VQPVDTGTPNNETIRRGGFVGLNEAYVQYLGLTSYPGEALAVGRQHIRQVGSEWWDQDIDAVRWVVNTSDRRFETGVARQFSTWRSDNAPVIAEQRGRNYVFVSAAVDWQPDDRIGARVVHALDSGDAPQLGQPVDGNSKLANGQLTWLGLYLDNGFYNALNDNVVSYWAEFNYLIGQQTLAGTGQPLGSGGAVISRERQDVTAYAGSGGLRWQISERVPTLIGAMLSHSSGGGKQQYQQTGVQSNASSFAGTRLLVNRYNETLAAELGNLQALTAFATMNFDDHDFSIIGTHFRRADGRAPVVTNNVVATPVNGRDALGTGVDVIATHYFGRNVSQQRLVDQGDTYQSREQRSLLSLRASAFDPGAAYGPGAKLDYRVLLEATLWLN